MTRPRVVIADGSAPTRTGGRLALEDDGFIVTEEDTATGAVAAALRDQPDLCLLDVDMPGGGIEAPARSRAQLPQTQVVMLGAAATDADFFAALEAGASGYLLKEMHSEQLGRTLRAALRSDAALPRTLTARLIDESRG